MGKKNPVAFVLRTPVFRPRKTKVVKGKGAYTRKPRHRTVRTDGVFFCVRTTEVFSPERRRIGNRFPLSSATKSISCSNCGEITLY